MSPHPTSPPHDADQDQSPASVLPHTEPQEGADTNPTPTSPDPASGNRAPAPPEEEASPTVPSDQLVGASTHQVKLPITRVYDPERGGFRFFDAAGREVSDERGSTYLEGTALLCSAASPHFGYPCILHPGHSGNHVSAGGGDWPRED